MKKEYLYLLQSLSNKKIFKIGVSKNIDQRLKTLQNTSAAGVKLIYLFEVKDMFKEEAYLKNWFRRHNTNGEWYELITVCRDVYSYKILEAIGKMYEKYILYGKHNLDFFERKIEEDGIQFKR